MSSECGCDYSYTCEMHQKQYDNEAKQLEHSERLDRLEKGILLLLMGEDADRMEKHRLIQDIQKGIDTREANGW